MKGFWEHLLGRWCVLGGSLLDGDCHDCENARVTVASREAPDAGTQINGSPREEIPVNMDYIVIHQAFLPSLLSTSPPAIHQLMHQSVLSRNMIHHQACPWRQRILLTRTVVLSWQLLIISHQPLRIAHTMMVIQITLLWWWWCRNHNNKSFNTFSKCNNHKCNNFRNQCKINAAMNHSAMKWDKMLKNV